MALYILLHRLAKDIWYLSSAIPNGSVVRMVCPGWSHQDALQHIHVPRTGIVSVLISWRNTVENAMVRSMDK